MNPPRNRTMPYHPLDITTAVDYLRAVDALDAVLDRDAPLRAREVGDGNLNQVFIIENEHDANQTLGQSPARSVVLKQALPYLRVVGESWPLTRERMRFETQALRKHHELATGLVPQIFHADNEMSLVVMEYLGDLEVMRRPLVARQRFPHFADHASTFLARTLFFTSDLHLSGPEKKALQATFINPQLCKIQEDFVFTNPFMESDENNWNPLLDDEVAAIRRDGPLKIALAELKARYMTNAQALIHSDLHTGSIMVNERETRVIDPEFAFMGPMGFDIGALLENLVLNYLSHFAHTPNAAERADYQNYLLDLVRDVWQQFDQKFDALWQAHNTGDLAPDAYWQFSGGDQAFAAFRQRYLADLLHDVAGFGGAKMLRRMMGLVSVWDISSIEDDAARAEVERRAIRIGRRWVLEREQVDGIEDLLDIVREEC